MKMFSDCSGACILCSSHGHCVAGHGDDLFHRASDDELRARLEDPGYAVSVANRIRTELGMPNVPEAPINFGATVSHTLRFPRLKCGRMAAVLIKQLMKEMP